MAQEHDGTHEAVEAFIREGIALGLQLVAHRRANRERALLQARASGRHRELGQAARDALEASWGASVVNLAGDESWWDRSTPREQIEAYIRAKSAEDDNPLAARAVRSMNEQFRDRYGFEPASVPSSGLPDDQIEARFAEHLAQGVQAHHEGAPAHTPRRDPAAPAAIYAGTERTGLDQHALDALLELNSLAAAKALVGISHVGDIHDVARVGAQAEQETQARRAAAGAEQSAQRDQGK